MPLGLAAGSAGIDHDRMSERPADLQAAAKALAGLSDEELAARIARSAAEFAAAENGPDTPDAYPLHAPPRTPSTDR